MQIRIIGIFLFLMYALIIPRTFDGEMITEISHYQQTR